MGSSKLLIPFVLVLHLVFAIIPASAQLDLWAHQCDDTNGNYTSNSTYKSNLDTLLTKISTTNITYGFYNFSAGQDLDRVNAIALCRGDVNVEDCHTCLNFSASQVTGLCPNQKEAIGWADNCMLRYSDRSILGGVLENEPSFQLISGINATDMDQFESTKQDLLPALPNKTAGGDSRLKFATGEARVSASHTIYAFMQCTPDLTPTDCLGCLYYAMFYILHFSKEDIGQRVLLPSCFIRFESQKFYTSDPDPSPSSPTSSIDDAGKEWQNPKVVISTVVGVLACISVLTNLLMCCWLRKIRARPNKMASVELEGEDEASDIESWQLDFSTIRDATGDFSEDNLLGRGGFGAVYKGTLPNGQLIAAKRLASNSRQGESEFKNEVLLVAKLHHKNLVRLLGFCLEGQERLLVYEFVSNGSLDYIIFDATKRVQLDWKKRYQIIGGIARGLLYLHEDSQFRIVHRDLKASNILLDENLTPKIADFGMARLFHVDQTHADTRRIAGTYGYMSPEYARYGFFSVKSDVYSFGVLILEIVSGQRNINCANGESGEDLINLAWQSWKNGRALDIVDPMIAAVGSQLEMTKCIHIGLLCVQENLANRPTMSSLVHMLFGQSFDLPMPLQPAYVLISDNRTPVADGQSNKKLSSTRVDLELITDLYPR